MLVEFWGDRAFGANLQRFVSSGFIRLALLTDISWKGLCGGQGSWTKTELNWTESAQKFSQCKRTTTLAGLICPHWKIVQNFLRLRARMFIAMQILTFHTLRNVNIFAYWQMLTVWLGLPVVERQGMIYFSSSVSFFMPENEISNSFKVIMAFILFHYYFLLQKN